MNVLISRNEAINAIVSVTAFPDVEYIKNLCQNPANSEDWLGGIYDAINAVKEVNIVDAAPVVHGRWIDIPDKPEWDQKMCSVCGDYFCCQNNYCPNCGAKMDIK